jgi:hypothetical protein
MGTGWKRAKSYRLLLTAAEHVVICKKLFLKLLTFLLNGTKTWVVMTARLLIFVMILMPGWVLLLRYYFFDPFIMKNIPYGLGGKKRNLLDVYLPYTRYAYYILCYILYIITIYYILCTVYSIHSTFNTRTCHCSVV